MKIDTKTYQFKLSTRNEVKIMSNNVEKTSGGISAFDFFCIGFGAIVGVGWAVSINGWMANCGGPLPAAVGYLIALVMMVPVALCYCELAPMMPVAGGGMAYAYRAFNEKVSYISGWAAFGAFVSIIPWEAIYVCDILSILIPGILGPELYTFAGSPVHLGHFIVGFFFSFVIFGINVKGATTSATTQRFLTVFLVAAGVIAMIMALVKFDTNNFQPIYENVKGSSHDGFWGGALAILASAPFFLAGFETIPQAVEEADGDVTSVGKTVVLSVGLACVFYAALLFCLGSAMPWQEFYGLDAPAASNLFTIAYGGGIGTAMYYLILIGAICGLFSTWNGFMMASPRLLLAMSRAYSMPKFLSKLHPKYGTPINGLIVCLCLSLAGPFMGIGLINSLTSFSAAGFVLSWCITSWCAVKLRKTEPDAPRPYKMPGGTAMATASGIMMTILLILLFVPGNPVYMGSEAITMFIGWMVIGLVVYVANSSYRNSVSVEERERCLFATAKK